MNDSLCTMLCLQWESEIIAIAAIHLAAKFFKFKVKDWQNRQEHHKHWWDQYVENLDVELVDDICHSVLDYYGPQTGDSNSHSSPGQAQGGGGGQPQQQPQQQQQQQPKSQPGSRKNTPPPPVPVVPAPPPGSGQAAAAPPPQQPPPQPKSRPQTPPPLPPAVPPPPPAAAAVPVPPAHPPPPPPQQQRCVGVSKSQLDVGRQIFEQLIFASKDPSQVEVL